MRLGILGGGRAAWAFGSAWLRIGWPITGVWLRSESTSRLPELLGVPRDSIDELAADSELLLVAVSDRAIGEVAEKIPKTDGLIFHASGAQRSLRGGFSLHPLKSLKPVGEPSDLNDSLLVFEGAHRKTAKLIAKAVGARFAEVTPEQKAMYHAGAVFGSNYVAAVLDIASSIMKQAGVEDVRGDLVALALSAIENWQQHDDARRFTGPAIRGDKGTVERHLAALAHDPQVQQIYKLLADRIAASNLAHRK